jgi:hypothetical protein
MFKLDVVAGEAAAGGSVLGAAQDRLGEQVFVSTTPVLLLTSYK